MLPVEQLHRVGRHGSKPTGAIGHLGGAADAARQRWPERSLTAPRCANRSKSVGPAQPGESASGPDAIAEP